MDAELWSLERGDEARRLRGAFERWVAERGGEILDAVRQPHLTLHRIRRGRRRTGTGSSRTTAGSEGGCIARRS